MAEKVNSSSYRIWEVSNNNVLIDFDPYYEAEESMIELNLKAAMVRKTLIEEGCPGLIDSVPANSSLQLKFDPKKTDMDTVVAKTKEAISTIEAQDDIVCDSRIITVPILFGDPWTKKAVEQYCKTIKEIPDNIEVILEENGLSSLDELAERMTSPTYWVCYVGFSPGLPSMLCMDPRYSIMATKYEPPRTFTPKNAIGQGGANTSIYSEEFPGGFQLFGRSAADVFDLQGKNEDFRDNPVLFKVTDRVRLRRVDMDEYEAIREQVESGTYKFEIEESQFVLSEYRRFIADLEEVNQ